MKKSTHLIDAVFNTELNTFCRKFLIEDPNHPVSNIEALSFPKQYNNLRSSIFESILINEKINYKVYGENVPLVILLNELGLRSIEELIDEDAINFTLWEPIIVHMVENMNGVQPIAAGRTTSLVHSDPEESISVGLSFMKNKLRKGDERALIRKLRDKYFFVPKGIEHDCIQITMSALESGKLSKLGFNTDGKDLFNLKPHDKNLLTSCTEDILTYKFLTLSHSKAEVNERINLLFKDSYDKLNRPNANDIISKLIKIDNFPDLKKTCQQMGFPMHDLVRLRNNRHTKKFRNWLKAAEKIKDISELERFYIDSVANPKGILDSFLGKATKSVSMMAIGAAAGTVLAHQHGPYIGAISGAALDKILDFTLDMADEYFLSELLKGWTPRMFINEINNYAFKYKLSTFS